MKPLAPSPLLRPLRLVLLAALFGGTVLAQAADATPPPAAKPSAKPVDKKPRESSFGSGDGTGALLTMAQLRQCMTEQDRMDKETDGLVDAQRSFAAERSEVDRLGAELKADQATLDRTSQAAVDAYNAKLAERDKRAEAFRAAAGGFNQRVEKLEADKKAFAKDCADRRYREDDYNAIKAGK